MAKEYPKVAVCQALGVSRSSLYYRSQGETASELQRAISDVCAEFPCYGYRRVTAELGRHAWQVNRKRVARWMTKMGLQAKKVVRKRRTTNSQHPFPRYPNLVEGRHVFQPDEVWVADITYVRLKCQQRNGMSANHRFKKSTFQRGACPVGFVKVRDGDQANLQVQTVS